VIQPVAKENDRKSEIGNRGSGFWVFGFFSPEMFGALLSLFISTFSDVFLLFCWRLYWVGRVLCGEVLGFSAVLCTRFCGVLVRSTLCTVYAVVPELEPCGFLRFAAIIAYNPLVVRCWNYARTPLHIIPHALRELYGSEGVSPFIVARYGCKVTVLW